VLLEDTVTIAINIVLSVVQGDPGDIPNHLTELNFPKRGPPGPPVKYFSL